MIEKLEKLEKEFVELEEKLADIELMKDQEKYTEIHRRHKEISKVVGLYKELKRINLDMQDAENMLSFEKDKEILELAQQQLEESKIQKEKIVNTVIHKENYKA